MTLPADATLADEAVALATSLLETALANETRAQRKHRKRMARMLADEESRDFTLALADEVLRIHGSARAAARLREVIDDGLPPFLGPFDRLLLKAGAAASRVLPGVVMPMVAARVRRETEAVLLPSVEPSLAARVREHAAADIRMNLNLLGEAILGEDEARRRVADVIALLERDHVDYVSVKISAICSQLDVLAFEASVERITARMRELYRAAMKHEPNKFVNLDMEEYRDLHLTVASFTRVLDESEFEQLEAGIVLQAYLPDSHAVAEQLCEWAAARVARGGAGIKIRLVKGANLAMEHVDAEMHGWTSAPFDNKADVDANYKRMLDVLLRPSFAGAVRVGVASHNLFDVAWALVVARAAGAIDRVEIEMLEGMASPQSAAVAEEAGGLLLYGPATDPGNLEPAVAYLARRLDENAAPENFLHALFTMTPGSDSFVEEEAKFRAAVAARHLAPPRPRRQQDRFVPHDHDPADFANEPDTDFTSAVNRRWITARFEHPPAPYVRDRVPTTDDVDAAVARALAAAPAWAGRDDRAEVLRRVAHGMATHRGETLAVMAHTAGKTVAEGDGEVSEAIDFARYYAATIPAEYTAARFEPHKVIVVASPWNFPYAIPAGGVLAALAAGSSVILKPAPETRHLAQLVVEHCVRGGVPADVVQFLPTDDDDAGRHLITHDDVDAVILTGAWETAQLFRSWKPRLALHAETSGKNAMVITAAADLDAAIKDLVKSAFGHAGQKCSAASLAILEAPVYDDDKFLDRLADAVQSLRVGPSTDFDSTVGPIIGPARGPLLRALTSLDSGERWLVEPQQLGDALWTPGVKIGVKDGSWFHGAECFGPVLGIMRAASLDEAIRMQNATPFGLTAGIQSLDPNEVERWKDRVEAGNLYVNRPITGAIVQRQPFGGWKRSAVGPGAKAGGPNYVGTMGHWVRAGDGTARHDFEAAWVSHFAIEHDPSGLVAESNVFRYVAFHRPVVVRMGDGASETDLELCYAAARTAGVTLVVARDESDDAFVVRLGSMKPAKVRALGRVSDAIYAACDAAAIPLDDAPVVPVGRIELLRWVREQSVSGTQHRYGNIR